MLTDAERGELRKDVQLGVAVAFAVSVQECFDLNNLLVAQGVALDAFSLALANTSVVLLFGSWARMMLDTAPDQADRKAFAGFIIQVLQISSGWILGPGLASAMANSIADAGLTTCFVSRLLVACLWACLGYASTYLPSQEPRKRQLWYGCPPSTFGLHVIALWTAALPLPIAVACNNVKNDLISLGPLPSEASFGAIALIVFTNIWVLLLLASVLYAYRRNAATACLGLSITTKRSQRLDFLVNFSLAFLEAQILHDVLIMLWKHIVVSPCRASTLFSILEAGVRSQAIAAPIVTLAVFFVALLKARAGSSLTPKILCGYQLPAMAVGILVASVGPLLGFCFKDSWVGIVGVLFPVSTIAASASLVFTLVGLVVILCLIDFVWTPLLKGRALI